MICNSNFLWFFNYILGCMWCKNQKFYKYEFDNFFAAYKPILMTLISIKQNAIFTTKCGRDCWKWRVDCAGICHVTNCWLFTGHDYLQKQLHCIDVVRDPFRLLCDDWQEMDIAHLEICTALVDRRGSSDHELYRAARERKRMLDVINKKKKKTFRCWENIILNTQCLSKLFVVHTCSL